MPMRPLRGLLEASLSEPRCPRPHWLRRAEQRTEKIQSRVLSLGGGDLGGQTSRDWPRDSLSPPPPRPRRKIGQIRRRLASIEKGPGGLTAREMEGEGHDGTLGNRFRVPCWRLSSGGALPSVTSRVTSMAMVLRPPRPTSAGG